MARCKGMNQHVGCVDSTACAGEHKGVKEGSSVKWHR
jgi:hypothetical protein